MPGCMSGAALCDPVAYFLLDHWQGYNVEWRAQNDSITIDVEYS